MNIKSEVVYGIVAKLGRITSVWPTRSQGNIIRKFLIEFQWCFSLINVIGLLAPLIVGVYHNRHRPVLMMKTLSELTALGEVFFNLILCKFQKRRLEILLAEVDEFIRTAKDDEKAVLQKYVNRYLMFCAFVGLSYCQTAVAFSLGPLMTSSIIPADAWYIFPVENYPKIHVFIYLQQVLAIIQTGMNITVDFIVALLLSYVTARMEILSFQFNKIVNKKQLDHCIEKHQEFIKFVDQLSLAARFLILKSNVTMAMAVIFGAFPLIYHEPLPVISQFLLMVVGGCLRLYITAWPADDLREMSEQLAWSVYNSMWIGGAREIQKSIGIVIQRAQKPLVISVHGVLPALTKSFYASFLSSTLSYFMTLRAILGK